MKFGTMALNSLLAYINNYVSLTEEEERLLETYVTKRTYLKGQYILQQGDICRHSSFITKGCSKMFVVDADGQEHIIILAVEGWWNSDIASFINQKPADFNIQCIEDTEIVQFHYDTIETVYTLVPKLEKFFRKILERGLAASQKRIIRNFTMTAKDRYLYFKASYPDIDQRIPQYMVASYLGITKEFLSKIKSQIAQER